MDSLCNHCNTYLCKSMQVFLVFHNKQAQKTLCEDCIHSEYYLNGNFWDDMGFLQRLRCTDEVLYEILLQTKNIIAPAEKLVDLFFKNRSSYPCFKKVMNKVAVHYYCGSSYNFDFVEDFAEEELEKFFK